MRNRTSLPIRRMGTWAATAMVVSEVVGVGIFLTPAAMTRSLGSLPAALVVWLVIAGLSVAGALCYTELATRFPRAGGAYVYLREGFGLRCAFVYGWMSLLVLDPGLVAALGVGLARYLIIVFGVPSTLLVPVALASIIGFGLITLAGVHVSARVMEWTVAIKLAVVTLLVASGVAYAIGPVAPGTPVHVPEVVRVDAVATAALAAFFAFGGWWELGRMSEEVDAPHRTIPRALLGGVAIVTMMYVLVTVAFMLVPVTSPAASDEAIVTAIGVTVFGGAAARILPALVAIAVSGTLAAVLVRAPRGYLAMARDGVLPKTLATFDGRRGTAPASTGLQVMLACALVLLGTFDAILGYFVPAAVFFIGLAAAAVLRLPRPAAGRQVFLMPWYPLPLILFLVATAAVVVVFAFGRPVQTLAGAAVVGLAALVSRFVIADARLLADPRRAPARPRRRSPRVAAEPSFRAEVSRDSVSA